VREELETLVIPVDGVGRTVRLAKYPRRRYIEWLSQAPIWAIWVPCWYFMLEAATTTTRTLGVLGLLLTTIALQRVEAWWEQRRTNWIYARWLTCEMALQHPDLLNAELAKTRSAGDTNPSVADPWPGELHVSARNT
jgi:hypothetical protein